MQDFLDEYDEIHNKLQVLYDYDIKDKRLRKEVFELIAILEEDFEEERNNCEEALSEEADSEQTEFVYGDYLDRL